MYYFEKKSKNLPEGWSRAPYSIRRLGALIGSALFTVVFEIV